MTDKWVKQLDELIEEAYNNAVEEMDIDFSLKIKTECNSREVEDDLIMADKILTNLLEQLGFKRTVASYNNISKYYS